MNSPNESNCNQAAQISFKSLRSHGGWILTLALMVGTFLASSSNTFAQSNLPFQVTCPTNKTVSCVTPWSFNPPVVQGSGGCSNISVSVLSTLTNQFCPLTVTRNWLVTNSCFYSNVCSQAVTVTNPPPVISCPTEIVAYTCSNSIPVAFVVTATNFCKVPTTNDCASCPSAFVATFPASGSRFGLGTNTVVCWAWDACGISNWCEFNVVVLPDANCCVSPSIVTNPQDAFAPPGGSVVFTATVTGTPLLNYQWYKDGITLPSATGPTLELHGLQSSDSGSYHLSVANTCGSATSHVARLNVTEGYFPDGTLTVSVAPYVITNNDAVFTITVQNNGALALPPLNLTGFFSGVPATLVDVSPGLTVNPQGVGHQLNGTTPPIIQSTQVVYTVTFRVNEPGTLNFAGTLTTVSGELNVADNSATAASEFGFAPVFTVQPTGFAGAVGDSGSMTAAVAGSGPVSIVWMEDGVELDGAVAGTLNFTDLHTSDGGEYQLLATNPWGETLSDPATVSLTLPSQVTASIQSRVVRVIGTSNADNIEVRWNVGSDRLEVDDLSNGTAADFTYQNGDWDKLVIELGDGNSRLVFDDAGGSAVVTSLNKQFEIHSGSGSNVVIASTVGLDLNALPGLMSALDAEPDFSLLATNLFDEAFTNLMNGSLAMIDDASTNTVPFARALQDEAKTNIFVAASNLVAEANQLAAVAAAHLDEAAWRFDVSEYPTLQFSNCLANLVAQLEAAEDAIASANDTTSDDSVDENMEAIMDQMDSLAENYESGAASYEQGLEASGEVFLNSVTTGAAAQGNSLGNSGTAFESLADSFAVVADQLRTVKGAALELAANQISAKAAALEAKATALVSQINSAHSNVIAFVIAADPLVNATFTNSNVACELNLAANNKVVIKAGGLIIGTPSNDNIKARLLSPLIFGLGGNDYIRGSRLRNTIYAGSGDDEVHAKGGDDRVFGNSGNDCLFGDKGNDVLAGDEGDDNLNGGKGFDFLSGGNGDDRIYGGDGFDFLIGGAGDDVMEGNDGVDLMLGGDGADTMSGGGGYTFDLNIPFVCDPHIGNLMLGGTNNDTMYGGNGIDVMFGGEGSDQMYSSNHVDVVIGGLGADTIFGDDGGALLYAESEGVKIGFRLGNLMFGGPGDDHITGGKDIDLAFGGDHADTIRGSYSYPFWKYPKVACDCGVVDIGFDLDLIFGGAGNDDLDGGYGVDFVFGGPGDDIIKGNGESDFLLAVELGFLFGNEGVDTITGGKTDIITLALGGDEGDVITGSKFGVMNILLGSQGADTINGNGSLINLAFGGTEADTIQGGGVALELLFGGDGDDDVSGANIGVLNVSFGGEGDDTITGGNYSVLTLQFGQNGSDTMLGNGLGFYFMLGNEDCDKMTARGHLGIMLGNNGDDEMHGGDGYDIMFGNSEPDIMTGGGNFDVMFGGEGRDIMSGDADRDVMLGNAGDDVMAGGDGSDFILGGAGEDVIDGGYYPDFIFAGSGHDVVRGGEGNDVIFGGSEPDCIFGGNGRDLALGGRGDDFIYGDGDGDLLLGNGDSDTLFGGGGESTFLLWNRVFGNAGNDTLKTEAADDRAFGNRDDDSFQNTGNNVRLRGGRGSDRFHLSVATGVSVFGGPNPDIFQVHSGSTAKVKSADSSSVTVTVAAPTCSEVTGLVWLDADKDGVRDAGEGGQPNVLVFVDLDGDKAHDPGEPYVYTSSDNPDTCANEAGHYRLDDLVQGTNTIRIVPPGGYHTTTPGNGHVVTLGLGSVTEDKDFGIGIGDAPVALAIHQVRFNIASGQMILSGSGAVSNRPFQVLSSTNLSVPVANWSVLATNVFTSSDNYAVTNSVPTLDTQRFFILRFVE